MSDRRFGMDTQVEQVNVKQNWVIPKPALPNIFSNSFNRSHFLPKTGRSWQLVGLAIGLTFETSGPSKSSGSDDYGGSICAGGIS